MVPQGRFGSFCIVAPMFINGMVAHTRLPVPTIECFHWLGVILVESVALAFFR